MKGTVDEFQAALLDVLQLRNLTGHGGSPSAQAHDRRIECGIFQLRQVGKNTRQPVRLQGMVA
ncbi:hypothetical protein D3C87_1308950 [compost metagenome]